MRSQRSLLRYGASRSGAEAIASLFTKSEYEPEKQETRHPEGSRICRDDRGEAESRVEAVRRL
ncbi:hypothetical protein [Leptolyngbya sp. FACHB-711]|uniref:hypothetical protein n=1 Tax=Leptolyngbya sp. FACHB-711 TaxID=2692813 RepID=UPI0016855F35|nr:hypothetical protein [Leptolyngbya sp. FACHB-711]MBD1850984.1 hypothetical protein [Cyanobacteria bacterium FACHB-502]MBD2023769.1 hypothetical protein [Leptolyngbya sp. FACHB-711]